MHISSFDFVSLCAEQTFVVHNSFIHVLHKFRKERHGIINGICVTVKGKYFQYLLIAYIYWYKVKLSNISYLHMAFKTKLNKDRQINYAYFLIINMRFIQQD